MDKPIKLDLTPELVALAAELADRCTTAVETQGFGPEGALAVAAMLIGGYAHGQGVSWQALGPVIREAVKHIDECAATGRAIRTGRVS